MADSDQSLYNLRYNQVTGGLEAFGGGTPQWTPLSLGAGSGGVVVQITQTLVGSHAETTSTDFVDTNLVGTITLTDPSHRVKITAQGAAVSGTSSQVYYTIAKDGVNLGDPVRGMADIAPNGGAELQGSLTLSWIDTPGELSPVYSVQFKTNDGLLGIYGEDSQPQILILEELTA